MKVDLASQPPRYRGPSRILRAALSLFLGVASTFAVAWASATLLPIDQIGAGSRYGFGGRGIVAIDGDHLQPWLIRLHRPTADRTIWFEKGRIYGKQGVGPPMGSSTAVSCWSFATATRRDANYTKGPVEIPEAIQRETTRTPMTAWGGAEDARGWPLPALRGRIFGTTDPRAESVWYADHAAILPPRGQSAVIRTSESLATVRIIPVEPIWRGIAVDSLVWTLIWFVALSAAAGLIGWIKSRIHSPAGHCPKCGYDLIGNLAGGCPECGWNRSEDP